VLLDLLGVFLKVLLNLLGLFFEIFSPHRSGRSIFLKVALGLFNLLEQKVYCLVIGAILTDSVIIPYFMINLSGLSDLRTVLDIVRRCWKC
jgi:hypothetical protein